MNRLFGIKFTRPGVAFVHDVIMAGIAFVLSMYLRVGWEMFDTFRPALAQGIPTFMAVAAAVFMVLRLYRGVWRYASSQDLIALVQAVTLTVLIFVPVLFVVNRLDALPRSVPLISWFVLLILLGGPRFAYRYFKDLMQRRAWRKEGRIPVLLLGAGDGAETFIRALEHDRFAAYEVVGVLDEQNRRVGRTLRGVSVLGGAEDFEAVVTRLSERGIQPQRLIVTRPSHDFDSDLLRRLFERCEKAGMSFSRMPGITELRAGTSGSGMDIKPVAIEDLLGRTQVTLDRAAIKRLIAGRVCLVTGAGGTIGSELCRQIAALAPSRLLLIENGEFNLYRIDMELRGSYPDLDIVSLLADVRDRERIERIMAGHRPAIVFHAAAFKHVPMVEINPGEGILTNAIGTRNVADAAAKYGAAAFVQISTDKAINPSSVMGASKRLAEMYCQALDAEGLDTRFVTVRFGNVLGSTGSVVPLFERQLAAGGPLTVTHPEIKRYFMTCREAVQLVLQASARALEAGIGQGNIFVLDMGEPVNILDLARQMIRLAGLDPDRQIHIVFTGLRPGEKLFEELFDPREPPAPSGVDGVLMAEPRRVELSRIKRALDRIGARARAGDEEKVRRILAATVAEYAPPEDEQEIS
ncbi:MAG: nucleoside-diphosphate sugar epimerase/dehydratase [Pseudomonadota bacterium]|nr:nucleoside-diphosphate sugar epimerase/dehydratase [Pseudomonadota bacterium]